MKSESRWASVPLFNTTALSKLLKCWFVERVPYMIHFSSYFKLRSYYWSTNSKESLFPSLNGVFWMCASSMGTDHCSDTNDHNARQSDQGQPLAVSRTCTKIVRSDIISLATGFFGWLWEKQPDPTLHARTPETTWPEHGHKGAFTPKLRTDCWSCS